MEVEFNKLYVGNIAWSFNNDDLLRTFQPFGEIQDARVIVDHVSGRSRGFGFVTFVEPQCAQNALNEMNGKEVEGRNLRVNMATARGSNQQPGGGMGGGPMGMGGGPMGMGGHQGGGFGGMPGPHGGMPGQQGGFGGQQGGYGQGY